MESTKYKTISPVKPVAPYYGGKFRLQKQIIKLIEEIPHKIYGEAFVGMGGIFLRRSQKPKAEVINDYSDDVVNLFRILNNHYAPFLDMFRYQLTSRAEFNRLNKQDPDQLTDLQRAARFLYVQRTTFGGKITGRSYGVSTDRAARFNITNLEPMLSDVHERLSGVTIEKLDWKDFIEKYDQKDILFYLDPPYFNCEGDYGKDIFDRSQYKIMARVLKKLKGKFLLSINNVPEINVIFKDFNIHEVETRYSISRTADTAAKELIITNQTLTL